MLEQPRIKHLAHLALHDRQRFSAREPAAIGTVTRQRVEDVGDAEDPRRERYRLATELVRIAAAVPALVMIPDHRQHVPGKIDALEQLGARGGELLKGIDFP